MAKEEAEREAPPAPKGIEKDGSTEGTDQNGTSNNHHHPSGVSEVKEKLTRKQQKLKQKNNPAGGFDKTPIPPADDGYTVRFTFHRAENLPISDINTLSSDPFIRATLTSALKKRHKEDPELVLRTPTVHKKTSPKWNYQWTVAGVPSSGFRLKCRLYDEDPSDHDDRLGNVTVHVSNIGKDWEGIKETPYDIKKRMGSKRGYLLRGCVAMLNKNMHIGGKLWMSMEVLGASEKPYGRMYTIGETYWIKHFSPMIGRMVGTKAPDSSDDGNPEVNGAKPKAEKYDFQANEVQLVGPVPAELYHRFVEFKPFVKGMFSKAGPRGRILNKALHHQHARVYNYDNKTVWGVLPPKSKDVALQFLKMVSFDEGGRVFTYVLTLDGLLRFTETGKEFGIDLLSKHTMHSDVAIYIACSGEFFVRKVKNSNTQTQDPNQESQPKKDLPGGSSSTPPSSPQPQDPSKYELVIDNDSGTYRPDASILHFLKAFLEENLPGLNITTKPCDDEGLQKLKKAQLERKKKEGKNLQLMQDSDGEISSSDEEALGRGPRKSKRVKAYEALEDPKGILNHFKSGGRDENDEQEVEGEGKADGVKDAAELSKQAEKDKSDPGEDKNAKTS